MEDYEYQFEPEEPALASDDEVPATAAESYDALYDDRPRSFKRARPSPDAEEAAAARGAAVGEALPRGDVLALLGGAHDAATRRAPAAPAAARAFGPAFGSLAGVLLATAHAAGVEVDAAVVVGGPGARGGGGGAGGGGAGGPGAAGASVALDTLRGVVVRAGRNLSLALAPTPAGGAGPTPAGGAGEGGGGRAGPTTAAAAPPLELPAAAVTLVRFDPRLRVAAAVHAALRAAAAAAAPAGGAAAADAARRRAAAKRGTTRQPAAEHAPVGLAGVGLL